SSRFDLVLFLAESDKGLQGLWLYNQDLFQSESIRRLSDDYRKLLESIVDNPEARLASHQISNQRSRSMKPAYQSDETGKPLKSVHRKAVDLTKVSVAKTSFLRPELRLPLVVEPATAEVNLAEWAAANRSFIDGNLLKHGALLFRGFSVDSVQEF